MKIIIELSVDEFDEIKSDIHNGVACTNNLKDEIIKAIDDSIELPGYDINIVIKD